MIEARVKYTEGLQFVGRASSGHAIVLDGDTIHGGGNTGLRPTELLLIGLGSCAGMGIISILKKKRQDVRDFEIIITGKKEETIPPRFNEITIEFILRGRNLSEAAVRRAVELSMEKHCVVKATIEGTPEINFKFRIDEDSDLADDSVDELITIIEGTGV